MTAHKFTIMTRAMPEEFISKAMSLREDDTEIQWRYGDLANEMYERIKAIPLPYTKFEVAAWVSTVITGSERAPLTILKEYMPTAAFFDNDARSAYKALPHAHFKKARSLGDEWQDYMELAITLTDERGGIPVSSEKAMRVFQQGANGANFSIKEQNEEQSQQIFIEQHEVTPAHANPSAPSAQASRLVSIIRSRYRSPRANMIAARIAILVRALDDESINIDHDDLVSLTSEKEEDTIGT